jgi:hypothetical protein
VQGENTMVSEETLDPGVDPLADIPVADPAEIPPDEGDAGAEESVGELEVEGLTPAQRAGAQRVIVQGARLLLVNAAAIHYTQGSSRWEGIAKRRLVRDGRYPTYGDCSSTATWLLWNALAVHLGMPDVVHGQGWRAGYTGTMLQHGRTIPVSSAAVGDLALYGRGAPGQHVVVCLGGGVAVSHGSERGPSKVAINYRPDLLSVRRYF